MVHVHVHVYVYIHHVTVYVAFIICTKLPQLVFDLENYLSEYNQFCTRSWKSHILYAYTHTAAQAQPLKYGFTLKIKGEFI